MGALLQLPQTARRTQRKDALRSTQRKAIISKLDVPRVAAPYTWLSGLCPLHHLKIYGAGQWLEEKHGAKSRRDWRKLHLVVDADSGEIIAHSLTDQETGDVSQLEPLLDQIEDEIDQFTADGAYDGYPTYNAVLRHSAGARVVIPPRSNAVEQPCAQASCQRNDHIASMHKDGRSKWQAATGYGKRALVETTIGRYKGVIGPSLRARSFLTQQTEAAIGVAILNRMLACGRPKSVRCRASAGAPK